MAKKWSPKILTSVRFELLVQNRPFLNMLTLKCKGMIDKNLVGVWPTYKATPHTF